MASAEFQFDTRIRRYHVPLKTQQHRLRHLRSISARNVSFNFEKQPKGSGLYYTLHHELNSEAFYTSENIFDTLNPTWRDIEPSQFPASVMLSWSYVTVRMWHSADDQLLVEWFIFFSGLTFLGKQIPKEGNAFKANTLIFGMVEGYYGCDGYHEMQVKDNKSLPVDSVQCDTSCVRTSCAFSTLGRIKTFERVITQIQGTAAKWKRNIESKLREAEKLHQLCSTQEKLKIKTAMLQVEVYQQKRNLMALERLGSIDSAEISTDQIALENIHQELKSKKKKLAVMFLNFWEIRENLLKTEAQLVFRRKELVSDLCSIYPVIQFPDQRGYSIHNVHLPNSEKLYGHDETMISVALGYVCHVLLMISQFINVPLRYDVHFNGSRSNISDHISITMPVKNRMFPLYSKGKDKRFFEYAVYLLNKNIAQLRILFGLTSKELSATLPNLYDLIEQRFSLMSEPELVSLSKNMPGMLDANKVPATTNGMFQTSNALRKFPHENSFNSEIELMRTEIAETIPEDSTNGLANKSGSIWTKDITNTFSGSLDKGLNDIKVLEKTQGVHNKVKQVKQISEAVHHSSYPNLTSQVQTENQLSDVEAPISELEPTPLNMWIVGNSHANSEDETIEENVLSTQTSDSAFQNYVCEGWTQDMPVALKTDSLSPQSVLLEKHDFEDDLTLRAEQLARRTSSFQMQRLSSLSDDNTRANSS